MGCLASAGVLRFWSVWLSVLFFCVSLHVLILTLGVRANIALQTGTICPGGMASNRHYILSYHEGGLVRTKALHLLTTGDVT